MIGETMTNRVVSVQDAGEQKALRSGLFSFFRDWDIGRSEVFIPSVRTFLFFSPAHATEPHLFRELLQRGASALYIGYLSSFFDEGGQAGGSAPAALRVHQDASLAELQAAFTRDPGFTDDAAIQYYVRSGFILAPEPRWAIWFSTYWEIAICGFLEVAEAEDFRRRHVGIAFMTSADVIESYSANPSSIASSLLAPHLEKNLLDGEGRVAGGK